MYSAVSRAVPLPLSLVHPQWFLDAPVDVPGPWVMTFDASGDFEYLEDLEAAAEAAEVAEAVEAVNRLRRQQGDRYRDHGANMAMSAAVRAVEYQKQLTGPQVECFATALDKNIGRLTAAFETQAEVRRTLPPELPNAIPLEENRLRAFKTRGRKRAMTGREAAEAEERDASRARRRKEIEAQREIEVTLLDEDDEVVFLGSQLRQTHVPQSATTSPIHCVTSFSSSSSSNNNFSSSFSSNNDKDDNSGVLGSEEDSTKNNNAPRASPPLLSHPPCRRSQSLLRQRLDPLGVCRGPRRRRQTPRQQ